MSEFLTLPKATETLEQWLPALKQELTKAGLPFKEESHDELVYAKKVPGEVFVLSISDVLIVGQPVEEVKDEVDERFSPQIVITEVTEKKGRIGVGHRQSYGARRTGLPQFKSVIECILKRTGSIQPGGKRLRNLIPELIVEPQSNGVLLHIGSVLVSEETAELISDAISNDRVYSSSHQ